MIQIRQITTVPSLMRWRIEVIRNVFGIDPPPRLLVANRQYFRTHIADNSHVAVVASWDGEDCGCGSVCFYDELPSPDNLTGHCAYLMNIYVRDAFRNKGIAHAVIRHIVEIAKSRQCGKIYLETTKEGKPVYLSSGFDDMSDMMKLHTADS